MFRKSGKRLLHARVISVAFGVTRDLGFIVTAGMDYCPAKDETYAAASGIVFRRFPGNLGRTAQAQTGECGSDRRRSAGDDCRMRFATGGGMDQKMVGNGSEHIAR